MVDKGSVYAQWNEDVRYPYVNLLNNMVRKINSIPRFCDSIHERDIRILKELAKAWNMEIDKEINLYDPDVFDEVKGAIESKMKKVLEEELKPEDPTLKLLDRFDELKAELEEKDAREIIKEGEYEAEE